MYAKLNLLGLDKRTPPPGLDFTEYGIEGRGTTGTCDEGRPVC